MPTTVDYQDNGNANGSTTLSFGGALDRTVNSQYIQEGVLNEIDFPTAGYTKFYYEPNKYLDYTTSQSGTPTLAGGLRVTKIESYDGSAPNPIVKNYKYGNGESGYGLPNFNIYQFNYNETQSYRHTTCGDDENNPSVTYRIRSYHSNSALSQDPFDSSPVMYPYVTEYIGDAAGANLGKTIYEFDACVPPTDAAEFVPSSSKYYTNSQFWKRGKLTRKTVYDNSGNKLNETVTTYTTYKSGDTSMGLGVYSFVTPIMWGDICAAHLYCTDEIGDYVYQEQFNFSQFSQSSGAHLPLQQTEYNYKSGDVTNYVVTQTAYVYDTDKLQLIQSTTTHNTRNDQSVTVNRYPFQLSTTSLSTGAAKGIYMLNSKNIVTAPIETYTFLQNTDGANQRIISAQATSYRQNEANANQVVPDKVYFLESDEPIAKNAFMPAVIGSNNSDLILDSNLKPRVNLLYYNEDGNIQVESKTNDMPQAYLYGYARAMPIAEVKNAINTQYQTTTYLQSTDVVGVTMGTSNANTMTQSYSFHVDYTGTVYLKLGLPGSSTYAVTTSYTGISSGSTPLASTGCGATVVSFPNVSPGNYTLVVTLSASGGTSVGACGEINFPKHVPQINNFGTKEFLYENFEETLGINDPLHSHTGNSYFSGDYTVNFSMPNSRSYKIEYWYYANSLWNYITKPYSGTSMILTEGTAIDDVRIYPVDARMKSYTYDPILGMTSIIDESSQSQRYEYDTFGRLKLIRDDQGKIVKSYQYHYKQ